MRKTAMSIFALVRGAGLLIAKPPARLPIRRCGWILIVVAALCTSAFAIESKRAITQFAHTAWGPKEGAPSDVQALAQSADGYLWLGTNNGLYRFDGVEFERYQPQSGDPLQPGGVSMLLALPNGDLWIGFRKGGISLLRSGQLTDYTTREGVPNTLVRGLAQDREGTIWAATSSGLIRLEGNRWKKVGKDWNFQWQLPRAIFVDRQGTLWVSTDDTLAFLPRGARRFQPTGIRVGLVAQIRQAPNGKLWMAETSRSVRPVPLSDKRLPLDDVEVQVGSQSMLFDNDGALWITSLGDGLRRAPHPESLKGKIAEFSAAVESFTTKDGLSDDNASAILQDREGNIWVGTHNGLDRFRKTNLVPILLSPTFLSKKSQRRALVSGDAGDVWVVDLSGVTRVHEGKAQMIATFPGKYNIALYAYRDPDGEIWWVSLDGIYRYRAGRYARLAFPLSFPKPYLENGIVTTEDGSGVLWLSAEREGIFYLENGAWRRLEVAPEFARLSADAAFTDWMGRVWIGYENGAIILLKNKNLQKVFPPGDSRVGSIRAIGGKGRQTWIGGDSGLAFFDGNHFRRIIPADAETFDPVIGIEETPSGLWLAESRGVIEIPANEVQQVLDDPSHRVKYRLFDDFDGLPGRLASQESCSKELQGTDGILWFTSGSGGIAWVDPAHIFTNPFPPPVLIRSVKANGGQSNSLTNLVLPPRTNDLQIDYTALSLSVPEKVRFRYKLEGVDKDWQDAGGRREAFYTKLGPGKYHFRVIACNNDGVWNDQGAHLDFAIAPAWYQTRWFQVSCVCVFLLLLWSIYQLRVRQLQRQFSLTLEARVDERTRIARELHDTLIQSVDGLMLYLQTAIDEPDRERSHQMLEKALDRADEVLSEGRERVHTLRAEATIGHELSEALTSYGKEKAQDHPVKFSATLVGNPRPLDPSVRDEAFQIGREALSNAFQHSGASKIEVELTYERSRIRLRIRDDGRGMDPQVAETGKPGHWGLSGMRERADQIGAELNIWSRPNAGTEIDLSIPAHVAYRRRFRVFPFSWIVRNASDKRS